ncbi:hypothetical protein KBB89_04065 [Candidatus Gracilibacteria bacterium]|nr:hypothetical protein [Candidatus Gracilibacteria bacterium]
MTEIEQTSSSSPDQDINAENLFWLKTRLDIRLTALRFRMNIHEIVTDTRVADALASGDPLSHDDITRAHDQIYEAAIRRTRLIDTEDYYEGEESYEC